MGCEIVKFWGLLLCLSLGALSPATAQYHIIPQPDHLAPRDGSFTLSPDTVFVVPEDEAVKIAEYFQKLIAPSTGLVPQIVRDAGDHGNVIEFKLSARVENEEGYRLSVRPGKITLEAATPDGLFYGVQTLRQMLPVEIESRFPYNRIDWKIAAVDITDAPRFPYRGMHLDVARSFFPVAFIKKYIDLIALHKMNKFHWHLTDNQGWRIEIKQYPRLTEIGSRRTETIVGHTLDRAPLYDAQPHGGYYSQAEIREVVQYAAERHVEVIPEIDIPGHATAMVAAYPELSCVEGPFDVTRSFGIFLEVLCPTETTFTFLDDVFREVAELFPSSYIHIGGDEVLKDQWEDCPPCATLMKKEGLRDMEALQGYFIRRVEKIVGKYDRKIIGWDEIRDGGIAPSAVIMSWRGMAGGVAAAQQGHDVIMTPGSHVYFDQYQSLSRDEPMSIHDFTDLREVYGFNPVPEVLTEQQRRHIKGAQGNVWTEYIREGRRVEHAILPRMSALAEVVWTAPPVHDYAHFLKKVDHLFTRFDQMNLMAARSHYKVAASGRLRGDRRLEVVLENDGPDVAIRYTLDGTAPDGNSPLYREPLVLDRSATVRAVGQDSKSGALYGDTILSFDHHKALGKSMTFASMPTAVDQTRPEDILLDGVLARDRIFQIREWAFVTDADFIGVIDLDKPTEVREVSIGIEAGQYRQLHRPAQFEVLLSDDNRTWMSRGVLTAADITRAGPQLTVSFPPVKARYVKFIATNGGPEFSDQYQKMVPTALHIDEVSVR